jgi:hypothetical protein
LNISDKDDAGFWNSAIGRIAIFVIIVIAFSCCSGSAKVS